MTRLWALLVPLMIGLSVASYAGQESGTPSAAEILERSIAYHDPKDLWSSRPLEITAEVRLAERLASERGYAERTDRILIDNGSGAFRYQSTRGDETVDESGDGRYKNYFTYVFGVPMKLRDEGTLVDPALRREKFGGREVLALRVTYSPEVGSDVWDFFFDPETYALTGCRFFHDETARDGEFLVYEGEIEGPEGLRLPRTRLWHMNLDDEYIATDEIISIR